VATCEEKRGYTSRLAAESALSIAVSAWRKNPLRAPEPPRRIYQCECGNWHLTHKEAR